MEDKEKALSKIVNSIELEIFVQKIFKKFPHLFSNSIIKSLEEWHKNSFSIKSKDNKTLEPNYENKISLNMFYCIVIKKYFEQMNLIYKKILDREFKNNKLYELYYDKRLPDFNECFISNEYKNDRNRFISLNYLTNYAYKDLREDGDTDHYFDSNPEAKFARKIFNHFNNNANDMKSVKLWTKNPVFQGLNFQYLDINNEITNSYPDFIFEIGKESNNKDYLYIEVKSLENDYDPEKTKKLINAYEEYLNVNNSNVKLIKDNNIKSLSIYGLLCQQRA